MISSNKPHSKTTTGVAFIVDALVALGVTHVFGGHGGSVVPLITEIEKRGANNKNKNIIITWVYCRCEVNASQAAAAYAKLHGRLGCCVATSGPGAAHLLSGLVDADQDRVPLLCITGMKDRSHIRYADFQDVDQGSIFRLAGLACSENVIDIGQLPPLCRNAVTTAVTTNRACHLAVPVDVQQQEFQARKHFCLGTAFQDKTLTPANRVQIDTLVMALRAEIEAERHVLIACGWRAAAAGIGQQVERLAELMRAPIVTSYDGKGTVNERHPLAFGVVGVYGNAGTPASVDLLEDCDTVISICVTDHTELVASKAGLQVRRLIQIEERLIAGDGLRFSPSTVFSCKFLAQSLTRVVAELERGVALSKKHLRRMELADYSENAVKCHEPEKGLDVWEKLKVEANLKPTGTPSTFLDGEGVRGSKDIESRDFCHPAVFFKILGDRLESDAVICADIGDNALWMASSLAAKRGQRFLTSEHMGIMGYGLNSGLAASISRGDKEGSKPKQTLVVAGDGGFQMSLNELATLRDHGAKNVLVVIVVNARLGRVQNETWGPRLKADGCHIGSPDFVKLFEAYGYPNGMKLSTCDSETITETIQRGWASAKKNGACVIELHQDPLVHPIMYKMPAKSQSHSSLVNWNEKTRNLRSKSIFPVIETDHWQAHNTELQGWLNSLQRVEKSKAAWLDSNDFVSLSVSKIVQDLLDSFKPSLPGNEVPALFPTFDACETFDSQFRSAFMNSFPDDVKESVFLSGTSNTHPLCLQMLACPKGYIFPIHAHPNVELDIPLVGELWERRALNSYISDDILKRDKPVDEYEGKMFKRPSVEELKAIDQQIKQRVVFDDQGADGAFVNRVATQGQVLYNEVGSVHQSYTKEEGCLLLVLWSGVHAHFAPGNFRQQTGVEGISLDA